MSSFWKDAEPGDFAVIGDPIHHSLSPRLFADSIPEQYSAIRVPKEEFADAMAHLLSLGFRGLNVTVPLKAQAYEWCDQLTPEAQTIGSVNSLILSSKTGTNTDWLGFTESLGFSSNAGRIHPLRTFPPLDLPTVKRALILGAGGAARAVAYSLAKLGIQTTVFARRSDQAAALARDFQPWIKVLDEPDPQDCELIINATSAHLSGQSPELIWEKTVPGTLAYDLSYSKEGLWTPFLSNAEERGMTPKDGLEMLLRQAMHSYNFWTGLWPEVCKMEQAL